MNALVLPFLALAIIVATVWGARAAGRADAPPGGDHEPPTREPARRSRHTRRDRAA